MCDAAHPHRRVARIGSHVLSGCHASKRCRALFQEEQGLGIRFRTVPALEKPPFRLLHASSREATCGTDHADSDAVLCGGGGKYHASSSSHWQAEHTIAFKRRCPAVRVLTLYCVRWMPSLPQRTIGARRELPRGSSYAAENQIGAQLWPCRLAN